MSSASGGKILGFNGLRGVAVILVFLAHKCGLRFYMSQMGVWLFLALSGFLIIGELHRARIAIETAGEGRIGAFRTFWIKRALRILPAYYAVLLILYLARASYAWAGPDLGFRFHIIYLSNYWLAYLTSGNVGPFGVLWSLSVEQQFYIFAPIALLMTPSRLHRRVCLLFILVAAVVHVGMIQAGVNSTGVYMTSPWNFAIIAGGGVAFLSMHDERLTRWLSGPAVLCGVLFVLACYGASWTLYRTENPEQPLGLFIAGAALVALLAWVRVNQTSWVVRALEWRPLEHLGVISYGFYLVHNFIPNPLGRVLPLYFGVASSETVKVTIGAAIGFVLSVAVAHLSWSYYEKPILRLRNRLVSPVPDVRREGRRVPLDAAQPVFQRDL